MKEAATKAPSPQPCLVVKGALHAVQEAALVVERQVIAPFPPKEAPLVLLSAFFSFNMHFTEGCTNFYTFLEVVFFKRKKPAKKTRLASIIARLT